jgi:hypothetical protein
VKLGDGHQAVPARAAMARLLLVAGALAWSAISCSSAAPRIGSGQSPAEPSGASALSPGSGTFEPTGLIGCFGQRPGFDPGALAGPADAQTAETPQAAALRAVLLGDFGMLPDTGWVLVSQSDTQAYFIHRGSTAADGSSEDTFDVRLEAGSPNPGGLGADGWRVDGYGQCRQFLAVPPTGYGPASWTLDPAVPYSPGATDIHILVDEWACHGSGNAEGRIAWNVAYSDAVVVVSIAVRSLEGMQTCPGTAQTPFVVHLDRPVGVRELRDGGIWPARTVAAGGAVVTSPAPSAAGS